MPLPLLPLAVGAVAGGGTVLAASSTLDKVTNVALIGGGIYLLYILSRKKG